MGATFSPPPWGIQLCRANLRMLIKDGVQMHALRTSERNKTRPHQELRLFPAAKMEEGRISSNSFDSSKVCPRITTECPPDVKRQCDTPEFQAMHMTSRFMKGFKENIKRNWDGTNMPDPFRSREDLKNARQKKKKRWQLAIFEGTQAYKKIFVRHLRLSHGELGRGLLQVLFPDYHQTKT